LHPGYSVTDYKVNESSLSINLKANIPTDIAAEKLIMNVSFFQNGIARISIDELNGFERRFRIADEDNLVVVESHLKPQPITIDAQDSNIVISGLASADGKDVFEYVFVLSPLRLLQKVNGHLVMTVFDSSLLAFEKTTK
jgi:hypothetical protein